MFENTPPNLPTAKEPEDILGTPPKSSVSPTPPPRTPPAVTPVTPKLSVTPAVTPSPAPSRPTMPALSSPVSMEKPSRSWIRVVLFLAVLGGLGVGVYFFIIKGGLSLFKFNQEAIIVPQAQTLPPPLPTVPGDPPSPPPPPPPQAPLDSDGDGLTDEDEAGLGTEPLTADTDGDGLLDNEEVRIYKSDPLNSDTDNDSFKDGDEVKAGYNPIGPGRLFQVPTQ